jgi:hypothetical protein
MLILWQILGCRLTDAVAGKGLSQIASWREYAVEEAGMGYPRILID